MKKLYLLLGLVFLLSISFVSAVLTDAIVSYSFNNVDTPLQDDSGNGITLTNNGATRFLQTGSNYAYDFDGTNDYMTFNPSISTGDKTYSLWIRSDGSATTTTENIFDNLDATNKGFQIRQNLNTVGDDLHVVVDDSYDIDSNIIPTIGTWYHILVTESSGTTTFYLNNVNVGSTPHVSTVTTVDFNLGRGNKYTTRLWNGAIDQVMIFDRALNSTERTELYNGGVIYNPYPPANITINDSTESTAVVKQVGSVSFSAGMTTILSSNFNVSVNETPLYGGYSFNVESNSGNTMYCELLIDGVVRSNITRTQTANQLGSVFIQTPTFLIDEGEHSQLLQCQRSAGLGAITITNADGIGHFLINQDLDFLPYNTSSFTNEAVSSGSSYTLIDSFTITIGNKTEVDTSQNRTNHIVLENQISYTNLGGSTELLSAYMSVNGTNCSKYPRTVTSGSTGSVSMDCILQNVTANATYTINVYANGSNAQYTGNTVAKNFFLSEGEIIGGTGVISGYSFSGANWNQIFNTSGGNLNHDVANAFTKLSYSVVTDINTQVDFYVVVADGNTFTTNTWSRDFVAGQTGVLIGHDILEDLPQDPNYNISLFARCGTGATCTIQGGSSLGYLTDVITTVLNGFNVSAYDYWDNSSISNFTVVDGGTWTTTTGSVFVFTENNPENLTISSNNYFDLNVNNHNTSNDYTAYLKQSDIKFRAYELGTNNSVSGVNFTIESVTFGVDNSFYLKAGSYNVTVFGGGYYTRTQEITVLALDNKTLRFDGNNGVGNTIFNISLTDYTTDLAISNFSVIAYSNESYDYTFTGSTTTGYIGVIGLQNDSYILNITSSGYASNNGNLLYNTNNYTAYNFLMFTYNSILINVFSAVDFTLIQPQQINISFIFNDSNFQNSTTTGQLYVDLLTPEDYELRFFTNGYNIISKYLTVTDDSTQNISIYLDVNTTATTQRFRIVDTSGDAVEGAVLRIQKEVLGYSENWVTTQETVTDSNGYCYGYIEKDPSIYYRFGVIVDGEFKPLIPSGNYFTTKTNFISSFTETIQLVVNLEEVTTSAIDVLDSITYDLSFTGNNSEYITFSFADGLSTIRGGRLLIYVEELNGTLSKTLVSNQSIIDFDGDITATLLVQNNTRYTVEAYILFQNSNSLVASRIITYEGDATIPASVGLLLAIIVMLFVLFITIILRPLLSIIITIGILYPLSVFGIISIPASIITSIIALGVILFVKVRGGGQQ